MDPWTSGQGQEQMKEEEYSWWIQKPNQVEAGSTEPGVPGKSTPEALGAKGSSPDMKMY